MSNVYNISAGIAAKNHGMAVAAAHRAKVLRAARLVAVTIVYHKRVVEMDAVKKAAEKHSIDLSALGNAAGSVFKLPCFDMLGRVKSERVANHARELKVWGLKPEYANDTLADLKALVP